MNKKPIKSNATSTATKSKPTTAATKAPSVTEEKTIVEKFQSLCSIQDFALIWLDEDFDQNNSNCRYLMRGLQTIANKIDVFNETDGCLKLVSHVRQQDTYLIISNPKENVLDHAHRLPQVTAIFIFSDRNSAKSGWLQKWTKIRGIFTNVDDLCQSVKETAKELDQDFMAVAFISANAIEDRKLDELNQSFMYTQLIKEILLQLEYDRKSIQELVTYCREQFWRDEKELASVNAFHTSYKKEDSVWWYTRDTFVYRMVNRALYIQEFDAIIRMGFFITDLHRHLVDLQKQQFHKGIQLPLYRGQGMLQGQFEELRNNEGSLLAFNNFLSTSYREEMAETFLERSLKDSKTIGVFFIINIDPTVSSAVYADIGTISFYETEAEVLFSLATVFRIGTIEKKSNFPRSWNVHLQLTENTDKQLTYLMDRIRVEIGGSTPSYQLGALMIKLGQYDKAEEIYTKLRNDTTDQREKANLYYQLGFIKYHQKEPQKALTLYQHALTIHQQNYGEHHQNIASIYNNIGLTYDSLNNHKQALEYYRKAQAIYENISSDDSALAACYNNIASVHDHQQDYRQALTFYEKSRNIYKRQLAANHPDLATTENNIGLVHLKLNQNREALTCFQSAVSVGTKALPPNHPHLLAYQNHLHTVKQKMNKYK